MPDDTKLEADEKLLSPERVSAVAQAVVDALGCKAVVIVAIGEDNARTVVGKRPDYNALSAVDDALTCAAGAIALARLMGGGKQGKPDGGSDA